MLVELSKSQDVVAGDGTTSVTVIAGALLKKSLELLEKGVHPTTISDAFSKAALKACEVSVYGEILYRFLCGVFMLYLGVFLKSLLDVFADSDLHCYPCQH